MRRVRMTIGMLVAAGTVTVMVLLGRAERGGPARCPRGTVTLGPRCCAPGQHLEQERCAGVPTLCPSGLVKRGTQYPGCVPVALRIRIPPTRLMLGPSDWEAQGEVEPRLVEVGAFEIDSTEVTHARWHVCAEGGVCAPLPVAEPGLPVTNVSAGAAARFCRFVAGRLPRGDEWLAAAAGSAGRRFPWGPTGLVCRRAVFGLENGPCATGAVGPDIAGLRPDGASPEGVLDLAGNVAEWTVEPGHHYVARGGSYRSKVAGDLKSWAAQQATGPADDIGFRCVYDVGN